MPRGRPVIVLDNPGNPELFDASGRPYRVVDGGIVFGDYALPPPRLLLLFQEILRPLFRAACMLWWHFQEKAG